MLKWATLKVCLINFSRAATSKKMTKFPHKEARLISSRNSNTRSTGSLSSLCTFKSFGLFRYEAIWNCIQIHHIAMRMMKKRSRTDARILGRVRSWLSFTSYSASISLYLRCSCDMDCQFGRRPVVWCNIWIMTPMLDSLDTLGPKYTWHYHSQPSCAACSTLCSQKLHWTCSNTGNCSTTKWKCISLTSVINRMSSKRWACPSLSKITLLAILYFLSFYWR